jgi:hypothetical protein
MDLAKIIGELKLELECLDTAIASMEELARVQSIADTGVRPLAPAETLPESEDPPPAKRRRGRPSKNAEPVPDETPNHMSPESTPSEEDSTASIA